MKKISFIFILLTIFVFSNLYGEPLPSIDLPCPNGGNIIVTINEGHNLPEGGAGGSATVRYNNCSIFKDSLYSGEISIGYSYLPKQKELWIDFLKGSYFNINVKSKKLNIAFPETISFEIILPMYNAVSVSWYCESCDDKPYILVNEKKFYLSTEVFPYLLPLK